MKVLQFSESHAAAYTKKERILDSSYWSHTIHVINDDISVVQEVVTSGNAFFALPEEINLLTAIETRATVVEATVFNKLEDDQYNKLVALLCKANGKCSNKPLYWTAWKWRSLIIINKE